MALLEARLVHPRVLALPSQEPATFRRLRRGPVIPDFNVVAKTDEAQEGMLRYCCWVCPLEIEGPYDTVMRLLSIHSAEHTSDGKGSAKSDQIDGQRGGDDG